jgi:Co/Zn/Cd efflux system component
MSGTAARFRVTGMDCSACAAKIEKVAKAQPGVLDVRVSIASGEMLLKLGDGSRGLADLESAVSGLGYSLTRLDRSGVDQTSNASHLAPGYKRALWIVVLLNAGYGTVELAGGLVAGSQAVKADALDFIGDGLISWLGLIAIGWGMSARAKAAYAQGVFLGFLGVGVVATTIFRVFVLHTPGAELMGLFGAVALVVNVLAAVALLPYRNGDANVRAVWLFSRNDAVGNLAVVIAAGLVAWTNSPWPDLVVAAVIAGLFLQSAFVIIRDARRDMDLVASESRAA